MFTREQIEEIARYLSSMGKKDSDFKPLDTWKSLKGQDYIAFVKDGTNRTISIDQLYTYIRENINGDIGNAIERITALETAVQKLGTTLNTFIESTNNHLTSLDNSIRSINEVLGKLTTKYTITVIPVTPNAIVFINGVRQNSMRVTSGSTVNVKVSAEGYDTYEEFILVEGDITLNPELSQSKVTLTIAASPSDSVVRLNGVVRRSITVEKGSSVHINVTASGYKEYDEDYIVNSTETKKITLESDSQFEYTDLKMTPSLENVPADGFQQQMTVLVSYIDWDGTVITDEETSRAVLTSEQDWIRIDGYMVTISENTSTESRSGKIKVTTSTINGAKTISREFNVVQLGTGAQEETISLVPESLQFTSEGGSKTVQVTSNANWEIQ